MLSLDMVEDVVIEELRPHDYTCAYISDAWWSGMHVQLSDDELRLLQDDLGDAFEDLAHAQYKANYDEDIDAIRWYHYS